MAKLLRDELTTNQAMCSSAVRLIFFIRAMTASVITVLDGGVGACCKLFGSLGETCLFEGVLPARVDRIFPQHDAGLACRFHFGPHRFYPFPNL